MKNLRADDYKSGKIDLHIHSTASDGTDLPETLAIK